MESNQTQKTIEQVLLENHIRVITIGIKCESCSRTWGVRLDGLNLYSLPLSSFICGNCQRRKNEQPISQLVGA